MHRHRPSWHLTKSDVRLLLTKHWKQRITSFFISFWTFSFFCYFFVSRSKAGASKLNQQRDVGIAMVISTTVISRCIQLDDRNPRFQRSSSFVEISEMKIYPELRNHPEKWTNPPWSGGFLIWKLVKARFINVLVGNTPDINVGQKRIGEDVFGISEKNENSKIVTWNKSQFGRIADHYNKYGNKPTPQSCYQDQIWKIARLPTRTNQI